MAFLYSNYYYIFIIMVYVQLWYALRVKAGVYGDDPFCKYQVVSDNLVISLLQSAQEVTGVYMSDYYKLFTQFL